MKGIKSFAALLVILLFGALYLINGWTFDDATLSSIPVILSAEAIVLGMLYMTIFQSEISTEEAVAADSKPHVPMQEVRPLHSQSRAA